jgi:hypothetical protein
MKQLLIVLSLLVATSAQAQIPECLGLEQVQCDIVKDCATALDDFDPVCLALYSNMGARNELAALVATLQEMSVTRDAEVVRLRKRVKALRRKVAEGSAK